MRHDINITGYAFKLRPIELSDAQLIVDLRTSQPERSKFLHPISSDVDFQKVYLKKYFDTPNDYYFVVERLQNSLAEGLIGIYDVKDRSAEWGRWILDKNSLAAIESCFLIYKVGFACLNLREMYCRTILNNQPVVSFHDSCDIPRHVLLRDFFTLGSEKYDAVEHRISIDRWNSIQQILESRSQQIAKRLNR
jgi:hypothetical protein